MKVTLTIPLAILCLLLGAVRPASATLVTIYIEGVVDTVHDYGNYLEGKINVGDPITGYYIYDTATPDSNPLDPIQGNYWHYSPPGGVFLSAGGMEFATKSEDVRFNLALRNNVTEPPEDIYAFASYSNLEIANQLRVEFISWQLTDTSSTALDSDLLTSEPPVLEHWHTNVLRIEGHYDAFFLVQGHVTSAVPEPTTFLLIGLATIGLFAKRTVKH